MVFSLIAVIGSWCFADRWDDDIPTVKAIKKSHTFLYVYIVTWCWQANTRAPVCMRGLSKCLTPADLPPISAVVLKRKGTPTASTMKRGTDKYLSTLNLVVEERNEVSNDVEDGSESDS